MKDSQQSIQAWTNRNKDETQEQQEYSQQFEKGYKLYQLSSQLNDAHLHIQKLSIDFQKQRRQDRRIIEKIIKEKEELQIKYQNAITDLRKFNTIQQAEKAGRQKLITSNKTLKDELRTISQKLGSKSSSLDSIIGQIQKLKKNKYEQEQTIQLLHSSINKMKNQEQQNKIKNQIGFNKIKETLEQRLLQYQVELNKEKIQSKNMQIVKQQLKDVKNRLLEIQSLKEDKQNIIQSLTKQQISKQQELKGLKLKQELWAISRERNREDKIRFDEKLGQIQFQLSLSLKKIEAYEQKFQEQNGKAKRFQGLTHQYLHQIRKRQNEQIILQEQCEQLKKKLYICDIYKEKYHKIQNRYKEQEQRAHQFSNIAQQYANQIHELQDSLYSAQSKNQQFQGQIDSLRNQIADRTKELSSVNLLLTRQLQTVKQKNDQIQKLKEKIMQLSKNMALLQYQKGKQSKMQNTIQNEQMLDEIKKKVSIHYERLFKQQENIRRSLQLQVNSAKFTICQMKNNLCNLQKQLAQERQDKELTKMENQRLSNVQYQSQKLHQKKIVQIRDTYRSMNKVKSQKSLKLFRKFQINSCFSYCLYNQYQSDKDKKFKISQSPSKNIYEKEQIYKVVNPKLIQKSNIIDSQIYKKIIETQQNNLLIRKQLSH